MIIVDNNVISELMKPSPADSVRDWILEQHQSELFTTSITVAEILYGIERLPDGQRKDMLRIAATEVFAAFENHVLPFDREAAVAYASLVHRRDLLGSPSLIRGCWSESRYHHLMHNKVATYRLALTFRDHDPNFASGTIVRRLLRDSLMKGSK